MKLFQSEKNKSDFSVGSIPGTIMRLCIPMLIAELVNVFYSLVDRMYIGHIKNVGTMALTGIGLVMPIITVVSGFANLFAMGGAPLCSIARGEKKTEEAKAIQESSLTMLLAVGLVVTAVLALFSEKILILIGANEETLPYALDYFNVYLYGTVFVMISLGMNPFISSQGFSEISMCTVLLGAALNLILDPVFIFGFGMGARGAAIATVISQFASAVWILRFLTGKKAVLRIDRLRIVPACAKRILKLGVTGFVFKTTTGVSQMVINTTLKNFGGAVSTLYIGAVSIINSLREVASQPIISAANASQPVMGFNYGAGCYKRVMECIRFLMKITVIYNIAAWILMEVGAKALVSIFTNDAELIRVTVRCMRIYFGAYALMALQQTGQNTFVALNRPKFALTFSLLRKIGLIVPLTLILPRIGFGAEGVFYAEMISEIIGASACFITMMMTIWSELKQKSAEEQNLTDGNRIMYENH